MSHLGSLLERHWRRRLWCLLASLFAAWTSTSHLAHSAASSAQQIIVAGAFSHTSHWIFILLFIDLTLFSFSKSYLFLSFQAFSIEVVNYIPYDLIDFVFYNCLCRGSVIFHINYKRYFFVISHFKSKYMTAFLLNIC